MKRSVPVSCEVCGRDMLTETTINGDMKVFTMSCPDPACANPGTVETFVRQLSEVHLCGPGAPGRTSIEVWAPTR